MSRSTDRERAAARLGAPQGRQRRPTSAAAAGVERAPRCPAPPHWRVLPCPPRPVQLPADCGGGPRILRGHLLRLPPPVDQPRGAAGRMASDTVAQPAATAACKARHLFSPLLPLLSHSSHAHTLLPAGHAGQDLPPGGAELCTCGARGDGPHHCWAAGQHACCHQALHMRPASLHSRLTSSVQSHRPTSAGRARD